MRNLSKTRLMWVINGRGIRTEIHCGLPTALHVPELLRKRSARVTFQVP